MVGVLGVVVSYHIWGRIAAGLSKHTNRLFSDRGAPASLTCLVDALLICSSASPLDLVGSDSANTRFATACSRLVPEVEQVPLKLGPIPRGAYAEHGPLRPRAGLCPLSNLWSLPLFTLAVVPLGVGCVPGRSGAPSPPRF